MTKSTYLIPTLALIGGLSFIASATAQTVTGSASISGNITINATGVFFNASPASTTPNPVSPRSTNTSSFAGPKGLEF
jgi:hypothetical protein